jgi:iron complex outermembrane receptor protein
MLGEKSLNPTTTFYTELLYGKQTEELAINDWRPLSGRIVNTPGSVGYAEMVANGLNPGFGFYFWQPNLRALRQNFDKSQMRAVAGLRGEWGQWDYHANIYQSTSRVVQTQEMGNYNDLGITNTGPSSPLLDARLLRPLDEQNTLTAQLLNARYWDQQASGQTAFTATEFRASRPLFEIQGKDVMLGWGIEARHERAESIVNATSAQPGFQGKRRNTAAYAELQIPVRPDWDVIAALRSDHYSDVGSTQNAKLATRWAVNSRLAFRGSVGTGFRAPSIGQMHVADAPFRHSAFTLAECSAAMLARTNQLSPSTGFPVVCPANGPARIFTNGNESLRPEKSTQTSLGLAFMPSRNLSISADYWRVDMRDTLQFESLNAALADPNRFASAYMVDPSVVTRNFGTESFHYLGFLLKMQNLGASVKEGVDIDVRYRIPTEWGRLMIGAQATHIMTSKEKISPDAEWSSDLAAYSAITDQVTPRLRGRLMFNLEKVNMNWQLNANFNSAYRDRNINAFNLENARAETITGRKVGSYLTWDLFGHYQLTPSTRIRIGIANLTDRQPPLSFYSPISTVWGVNSQNSSLLGRTVQLGMTYRF